MSIDDCYQLGYIVKAHGLKGELKAFLDVDFPEDYEEMESVLMEQSGSLVPFFISTISIQNGGQVLLKLEEVDSVQAADSLKGQKLYLPLTDLPDLGEGHFYYHELIGFELIEESKTLGKIEKIYQPSGQYLASVMIDGNEVLIPLENGIIKSVEKKVKKVQVTLPDGLLDLYRDQT